MKAQEILKKALNYWPFEIDIKDSKVLKETNGFISNNLRDAWNNAEQKADGNDWDELAVWLVYKILHKTAKINFENGINKINTSQIDIQEFERSLFEILKSESYEEMLSEYIQAD